MNIRIFNEKMFVAYKNNKLAEFEWKWMTTFDVMLTTIYERKNDMARWGNGSVTCGSILLTTLVFNSDEENDW